MRANTQKIAESIDELVKENERLKRVIATVKEYLAAPRKARPQTRQAKSPSEVDARNMQQVLDRLGAKSGNGPQRRKRRTGYASDVEVVIPPQI